MLIKEKSKDSTIDEAYLNKNMLLLSFGLIKVRSTFQGKVNNSSSLFNAK